MEMKLLHYSAERFAFDRIRRYEQNGHHKPAGLWLSVKGEDDWQSWCEGEQWGLNDLKYVVEVTLKPEANILLVNTLEKLDAFNAQYNKGGNDSLDIRNIAWNIVCLQYDGLIISPYQWDRRFALMWYYTWDCASGVIWNLNAIAECHYQCGPHEIRSQLQPET